MSEEVLETAEAAQAVEAPVSEAEAADTKNYTPEDLQKQLKPLSNNGFVRFFQKIGRWWLGVWYGFEDKHPKAAPWLYKLGFFFAFSMAVTLWQMLVMLFLPAAFKSLSETFAWPGVPVGDLTWLAPIAEVKNSAGKVVGYTYDTNPVAACFSIFGDTAGLGNWIAFEIAVFTAQCINFPLQRNITYKSHGNPWWQAMWYFIGWVGISFFTGAVWGIIDPVLKNWGWFYIEKEVVVDGVTMKLLVDNGVLFFIATLIKTFITGGVSMIIFFPIFLIIFPDNNKLAKKSKAKYEKLVAANAPTEKVVKAENKMKLWEDKATKSNAEKEYFKAKSQVNAAVMKYNAIVKASQSPKLKEEEKASYPEKIEKAFAAAVETIKVRDVKEVDFEASKAI